MKAQLAGGREVDLKEQIIPLNLTLAASWGGALVMVPFVVLPGHLGVVILGGVTLRENLDIDVINATVEQLEGSNVVMGRANAGAKGSDGARSSARTVS